METPTAITVIIEGWTWSISSQELTVNATIVGISILGTLLVALITWLVDRCSWNRQKQRRKGP